MLSRILTILLALAIASCQDTEFSCESNEKLSSVSSKWDETSSVRSFEFECEALNVEGAEGECTTSEEYLSCEGQIEGCPAGSWIGGVKTTDIGAPVPLMQAICCKSDKIKIGDCKKPSLLNFRGKDSRDLSLKDDEVFSAFKCYLVKSRGDDGIKDGVFQMQSCKYGDENSKFDSPPADTASGGGSSASDCPPCSESCTCTINGEDSTCTQTASRRRKRSVFRFSRFKRSACKCSCDCTQCS